MSRNRVCKSQMPYTTTFLPYAQTVRARNVGLYFSGRRNLLLQGVEIPVVKVKNSRWGYCRLGVGPLSVVVGPAAVVTGLHGQSFFSHVAPQYSIHSLDRNTRPPMYRQPWIQATWIILSQICIFIRSD